MWVEAALRGVAAAQLAILVLPAVAHALPELVNGVIASIDGQAVTLMDLKVYENTRVPFLPADSRDDRDEILKALVQSRIYEAEYARNGMTADDEDVEAYIDNVLRQSGSDRAGVREALNASGLKWDDYFERMREEVLRLSLVNREVGARVNITPEEVERAWKTDLAYLRPRRVEIAHIYLPFPAEDSEAADRVRALAVELYDRVRKRGFADAAREYSRGPTAAEGGILGVFDEGSMAEHFETAVEGLDEGEVSRPFEALGGMNLVRLLKVLPSGRVPLEEVAEELEAKLYQAAMDSRFRRFVEEDLYKRHHVVFLLHDLEALAGQ